MKLIKLIPIFMIIGLLSGCFGNEPNDIAYAVALGLDKADESGNYKITIQFARPTQISGGASEEGGKGGAEIVENVCVEAPDIYSGMGLANHIVSKKFSLSHAKLVVFSKEVAEEGIENIVDTLIRSNEIRPDVYFAVSMEGAGKYLEAVKPVIELNPAKYYQLIYEKNNSEGVPKNTTENFYFKESSNNKGSVMAIAGMMDNAKEQQSSSGEEQGSSEGEEQQGSQEGQLSQDSEQENKKQKEAKINTDGFEYKMKEYVAGEVAISKKNKSEAMGTAIFKDYKMIGIFDSIDTEIYNILMGEIQNSYTSFYEKEMPDTPVTVKISQNKKPKIKVDIENKKININVFLEADLYSLPAEYKLEENIESFEDEVEEEISRKCMEFLYKIRDEYGTDLIGIGEVAKTKFMTYKDFDEYDWNKMFHEYDININTDFKIRRTGLMIRKDD